jgi:DnaK suppressor protein
MAKKKGGKEGEGLDEETLEKIRADLMRKKAVLSKNINSEYSEMASRSDRHHHADMDDLGGDADDEETSYKILELNSAELDQIDYALEKLDNGTYGVCEECEKPINPERLSALPFATLCINCKRLEEISDSDF